MWFHMQLGSLKERNEHQEKKLQVLWTYWLFHTKYIQLVILWNVSAGRNGQGSKSRDSSDQLEHPLTAEGIVITVLLLTLSWNWKWLVWSWDLITLVLGLEHHGAEYSYTKIISYCVDGVCHFSWKRAKTEARDCAVTTGRSGGNMQ